ncbi:MAG: hypothetical protein WBB26_09235 [Saprospiraceae bacterium]
MKKLILHFVLIAAFMVASCSIPEMVISEELKSSSTILPISGGKFLFGKKLQIGKYELINIKKGTIHTKSQEALFSSSKYSNSSQKISFTIKGPEKLEANILAFSNFEKEESKLFPVLDQSKNPIMSIKSKSLFYGYIYLNNEDSTKWEFNFENVDGLFKYGFFGNAIDIENNEIQVKGINKAVGQLNYTSSGNLGFEYILNDQTIAALSLNNRRILYLSDNISSELKLVVLGLSAAILIRNDLDL